MLSPNARCGAEDLVSVDERLSDPRLVLTLNFPFGLNKIVLCNGPVLVLSNQFLFLERSRLTFWGE